MLAYPVLGPQDIILDGVNGVLDTNLAQGLERIAAVDSAQTVKSVEKYHWDYVVEEFERALGV